MKRISITFDTEITEKLQTRMQEKGLKSIAQCARELIDLGLKIEAMSQQKSSENDETETLFLLKDIKNLLKNNLTWSMESRLLSRLLVENIPGFDPQKAAEILSLYKEKSIAHIQGLCQETVD